MNLECALINYFFTRHGKQYNARAIKVCAVEECVLFTSARTFLSLSLTVHLTRAFQRVLLQFGICFSVHPLINAVFTYIYGSCKPFNMLFKSEDSYIKVLLKRVILE
jgi:hypothetical protein